MTELIFLIEEAGEGGFTARCLGEDIFTDGETWQELQDNIRDAVGCHYFNREKPLVVRMHYVRDEVIAV